ncbi:MAG: FG-GAP repeat protein, partial [Bacteroidales bacterium]|nr:FG-GAP repeat protein [Bacteroidales bacterium]
MKIINLSFKGMKLKLYRIIGLGLLTFLFSVSAMAQEIHYSVYGAGTPNVDGLYWNNDAAFIWNGKLIYVNEAFHGIAGEKFHIGFDGTRWIIGLNRDIWNLPMEEYYRNDDTGDIPPATGWYVYGSGTDPAPTVTSVPMWFQSQKIMSTIPTADYFIGQDIDISGDYAIIGNYENDNITANNGAAYLLKINTTTNQWEVNQFIEGNGSSVSCFGAGVAINATHYYISAPYNGPNTVGDFTVFGTVWESSLPTWGGQTLSYVSSSSILSSMGMLTRYFGEVVVADDEWVAVSVEGEEIHESEFGPIHQTNAVHIYSVGNFLQRKYAMPADYVNYPFSEDEGFGSAIAIDNDVLVVGAYLHDEDENGLNTLNDAGAVYIFAPPTSGEQWTQMQKIVPSDRAANDQFGISVGISGDYIFVGAPGAVEMGGNKIGAVYVFKNNGGTWVEEQKILKPEY